MIAERFREAVERYDWTTEDARLAEKPVNVDVGVVCLRLGPVGERRHIARQLAHDLLARADKLMYEAKGERASRIYPRPRAASRTARSSSWPTTSSRTSSRLPLMHTAVLFDVDGTLVDSNDAHAHAWVEAFAEAGVTVPFAHVRRCIGMGGDKLMPAVSGINEDSPQGDAHLEAARRDLHDEVSAAR